MEEQIDFFTPADKTIDRKWMKWMMSIMMSPLCFSYIMFFLRLDYAFATSNRDDAFIKSLDPLSKGEDGLMDNEKHPGTLVPSPSSVKSFDKPYYTAAWLGYVVAGLCLALLCSVPIFKGRPLVRLDDCDIVGFYLAFLGPPIMCMFVMVLAVFKGEFARVWAYEGELAVHKPGDA